MKPAEQILEFVIDRIAHIYSRPLMYGGTPEGVDLILDYYHELWAEIVDLRQNFIESTESVHRKEKCGSKSFSYRFREKRPKANNDEISKYVVNQWKKIDRLLGIPIG
jgi:hypothetical protein